MTAQRLWGLFLVSWLVSVASDGLKHMRNRGKPVHRDKKHDETSHKSRDQGEENQKRASLKAQRQQEDKLLFLEDPAPYKMPTTATVDATPLFVKFHKTGSGTAANVFRRHCPDAMKRLDGIFPWRGGPHCG